MIHTFIFFDLETTGLIKNKTMPKITELSLVAVSRSAICDTKDALPRVLHKLVLSIFPNEHISRKVENLTGLSNEKLKEVQSFTCETYNLVINFINQLTPPTCFVAYNGNKFDYPIFLWELQNINKVVSEDILSIDMLNLIKDFFSIKGNPLKQENVTQVNASNRLNTEDINTLLDDGCDKILSDALDNVIRNSFNSNNENKIFGNEDRKSKFYSNSVPNIPQTSCYKKIQEINEKTPENQIIKFQNSNAKFKNRKNITKRRLNFTSNQPSNFKLSSVYKHIIGTDIDNAHSAEGDCLSMIRCAIELGNFFNEWADSYAVPLMNHKL
ncbi:PREDICTED: uncharacterized protein LOC107190834 [Dufourea novaeangliae]|uniref:Three prime repair exonuclease 2 n=1 Tax=Dufourea novaeangliae TaxID=178035 RepID=A0A154PLK4_DUFNO|nr:PREDICTED: uncharacterized protein LOC107190834 [Dufourea novaeangliae]KZC12749.1 Three prime repair exonuclease 2 [Dufourea novaeangliae]